MVQTTQARDITLYELEEKFGLQLTSDADWFAQESKDLPTLSEAEKQSLEHSTK
jgi:hypothetical protein